LVAGSANALRALTSRELLVMLFQLISTVVSGKIFKVRDRVTKIIGERTQEMVHMKTPCIVLESVVCQARYSSCRVFCPKEMYPYWREIWLERVRPD
jgi:hypothetical protein